MTVKVEDVRKQREHVEFGAGPTRQDLLMLYDALIALLERENQRWGIEGCEQSS